MGEHWDGKVGRATGGGGGTKKRDFFGRTIVNDETRPVEAAGQGDEQALKRRKQAVEQDENTVWITFHEGFSNAVRKPITLGELLADL